MPSVATSLPAARLALLATRASLTEEEVANLDGSCVVAPDTRVLTIEEAAHVLAAAPKPLWLKGTVRGPALTLSYGALTTHPEFALWHEQHLAFIRDAGGRGAGGIFQLLRSHFGAGVDDLDVLCLGGRQRLRILVRDVEEHDRDYYHDTEAGLIIGADPTFGDWPQRLGLETAEIEHVVAMLHFRRGGVVSMTISETIDKS